MKKLVAGFLAVVLLAGCGAKSDDTGKEDKTLRIVLVQHLMQKLLSIFSRLWKKKAIR